MADKKDSSEKPGLPKLFTKRKKWVVWPSLKKSNKRRRPSRTKKFI